MSASSVPADLRTPSGRPLPGNGFDGGALVESFKVCAAHTGDVPLEELCNGMEQLRRIVLTLGSAFGIASSDITEKIETLGKRMADIRAMGPLTAAGEGATTPAYSAAAPRLTVQCACCCQHRAQKSGCCERLQQLQLLLLWRRSIADPHVPCPALSRSFFLHL